MKTRLAVSLVFFLTLSGCASQLPTSVSVQHQLPVLQCGTPCSHDLGAPGGGAMVVAAVDPKDARHFLVVDNEPDSVAEGACPHTGCGSIHVHVTFDGGATWSVSALRGTATSTAVANGESAESDDGKVAFLPDGKVLIMGQGSAFAGAGPAFGVSGETSTIFAARSADGGRTFPDVTEVTKGSGSFAFIGNTCAPCDYLQPEEESFAVASDGSLIAVWNVPHFTATSTSVLVYVARSADDGRTWTAPQQVREAGDRTYCESLALTTRGSWVLACMPLVEPNVGNDPGDWEAEALRSSDAGQTWQVTKFGRAACFPTAVQGGDDLVFAYPANDSAGTITPTIRVSSDDGKTWGAPVAIDESWAGDPAGSNIAATGGATAVITYVTPAPGNVSEVRAIRVANGHAEQPLTIETMSVLKHGVDDYYMGIARGPDGSMIAAFPTGNSVGWSRLSEPT